MKKVRVWGVACLACIGLGGYAVVRVQRFYAPSLHTFVVSSQSNLSALSDVSKKKIQDFLMRQGEVFLSVDEVSHRLKNSFPFIKKLTIAYKSKKKTVVKLESVRPRFVFNNQIVVTEGNKQLSCKDFNDTVLVALPHFSLTTHEGVERIPDECIEYVSHLDPLVHAFYEVEWMDRSFIQFHDKQHSHITVLGSAETSTETVIQPACRALVAMLLERKPDRKGTKRDWCIDGRFKGQMIVFPGGRVRL